MEKKRGTERCTVVFSLLRPLPPNLRKQYDCAPNERDSDGLTVLERADRRRE